MLSIPPSTRYILTNTTSSELLKVRGKLITLLRGNTLGLHMYIRLDLTLE